MFGHKVITSDACSADTNDTLCVKFVVNVALHFL